MKDNKDVIIKELEEKATKNGWVAGRHIFDYLDEADMFVYDNRKRQLEVEKATAKVIDDVRNKAKACFLKDNYEMNYKTKDENQAYVEGNNDMILTITAFLDYYGKDASVKQGEGGSK